MNGNIYLAQLLIKEQQHHLIKAAEGWQRLHDATPDRESLSARIRHLLHGERVRTERVTGHTWKAA
jgi:hypothetical protein